MASSTSFCPEDRIELYQTFLHSMQGSFQILLCEHLSAIVIILKRETKVAKTKKIQSIMPLTKPFNTFAVNKFPVLTLDKSFE